MNKYVVQLFTINTVMSRPIIYDVTVYQRGIMN